MNENAQIIIGDDLGVSRFVYCNARLDFINIPYIKEIGARIFTSAEVCYYPKGTEKPVESLRGSLGFGINLPINEMIALGLFYNFYNFGSRVGDIERTSYINFTL